MSKEHEPTMQATALFNSIITAIDRGFGVRISEAVDRVSDPERGMPPCAPYAERPAVFAVTVTFGGRTCGMQLERVEPRHMLEHHLALAVDKCVLHFEQQLERQPDHGNQTPIRPKLPEPIAVDD